MLVLFYSISIYEGISNPLFLHFSFCLRFAAASENQNYCSSVVRPTGLKWQTVLQFWKKGLDLFCIVLKLLSLLLSFILFWKGVIPKWLGHGRLPIFCKEVHLKIHQNIKPIDPGYSYRHHSPIASRIESTRRVCRSRIWHRDGKLILDWTSLLVDLEGTSEWSLCGT